MAHPDDRIPLNPADEDDLGPDLGPDERDRDLMDGSWEERYYAGRLRQRDWNSISLALALLLLTAIVAVPLLILLR